MQIINKNKKEGVKIEILTAPSCVNCKSAKIIVEKVISGLDSGVRLEVNEVDITEKPEIAIKHNIFFVPAILINEKLAFRNVPKEEELLKKIREECESKVEGLNRK